jgi:hypothetical protein
MTAFGKNPLCLLAALAIIMPFTEVGSASAGVSGASTGCRENG